MNRTDKSKSFRWLKKPYIQFFTKQNFTWKVVVWFQSFRSRNGVIWNVKDPIVLQRNENTPQKFSNSTCEQQNTAYLSTTAWVGGSERLSCHGVGMAPASVPFRNLQSFETSHTKRYHAAVTLRSSVLGKIWQILLKLQPSQHTRSVGQEGRGHSLYNNMVLQFDFKLPSFKATCVGFCFSAESWSLIHRAPFPTAWEHVPTF